MSRRVTGILAYCTIVGWLIAFFAGDRSARFHLNQGFVYAIFSIVLGAISGFFSWWLFWPIRLVLGLLSVAVMILCILGIVFAAQDREVPLPFGNLFSVVS